MKAWLPFPQNFITLENKITKSGCATLQDSHPKKSEHCIISNTCFNQVLVKCQHSHSLDILRVFFVFTWICWMLYHIKGGHISSMNHLGLLFFSFLLNKTITEVLTGVCRLLYPRNKIELVVLHDMERIIFTIRSHVSSSPGAMLVVSNSCPSVLCI